MNRIHIPRVCQIRLYKTAGASKHIQQTQPIRTRSLICNYTQLYSHHAQGSISSRRWYSQTQRSDMRAGSSSHQARSSTSCNPKPSTMATKASSHDNLINEPTTSQAAAELSQSDITPMATNFIILLPPAESATDETCIPAESLRTKPSVKARLLLLKRRDTADPFPGKWSAVSGRLEKSKKRLSSSDDVSSNETHLAPGYQSADSLPVQTDEAYYESPLQGALREIHEETAVHPNKLELLAALKPKSVFSDSKVGGADDPARWKQREWRVWIFLWRIRACAVGAEGVEAGVQDGILPDVRLNEENVDYEWCSVDELAGREGVIPGLKESFGEVFDLWSSGDADRSVG